MPSDKYVTTRISREHLAKLERLRKRYQLNSNTKTLHRLIDQAILPIKLRDTTPKLNPPPAPGEIKPVGLPPPE